VTRAAVRLVHSVVEYVGGDRFLPLHHRAMGRARFPRTGTFTQVIAASLFHLFVLIRTSLMKSFFDCPVAPAVSRHELLMLDSKPMVRVEPQDLSSVLTDRVTTVNTYHTADVYEELHSMLDRVRRRHQHS
jgi:hypothetical protein